MKNGGRLGTFVRLALPVCLLALVFGLCSSIAIAEEKLGIDTETLKQQLADMAVEKIFGDLHKVPEDKLKDVTYFNELVRDMAPLGIKLDETNFSDAALNIYNKYKEAIENGKTPEEARKNVKDLLKGDVKSLIFQSMDEGSQEVLTDLQGLVDNAKKELEAILKLNEELEENPSADYAELLKKYGVKGELLEKFEKVEGQIRGIVNSDYVKAGQIIYNGMSGSPGDKIEALFELGTEFGGKIPVLGRFVELYFKVAQEMLKATGRLGKLLDERQAGCLGEGTVGYIETVKSVQNERNIAFSKAFGGTACPVERTVEFYRDIYVDIEKPERIYFWTGSGFAEGNPKNGGVDALKALRAFLRSAGEADKANDMQFMIRAFNFAPGFLERRKEYIEMIEAINDVIRKFGSTLYCYAPEEFNNFLKEKGDLQNVIDLSDGMVDSNPGYRMSLWVEGVVEKILKDFYVKNEAKFGLACRNARDKLRDIVLARVKGEVFVKKGVETGRASSGVEIEADPADTFVEKCSRLSTDSDGMFEILILKEKGDSFSLSLKAKDGEAVSDDVSVSISGGKDSYSVKMTIEGECGDGQEMKDGKCVPICGEDEELNKDGTRCVPVCKANEERDENDKCVCLEGYETVDGECVEKCESNEKRNDKGECEEICPEGQKMNDAGDCESICKPNEKYIDGACEAVCEEGYTVEKDGSCIKECGEDKEPDEEGECVCKKGFEEVDGKCTAACGENEIRGADGNCNCISGYVRDENGVCNLMAVDKCTSDADCSTGYRCDTSSGECVFAGFPGCEETGCPDGYECDRDSGECVYIKSSACRNDIDCPVGYVCGSDGECVFKRSSGCRSDNDCPVGYVCGGDGECVFKRSSGCRSDNDCPVGYVCGGDGQCVSPFDPNYTEFTSRLGGKDDQRSQQNIDRSTADQTSGSQGGRFTSAEIEEEIGEIAENLGCRSNADCLSGYSCLNGRCREVKKDSTKPSEETTSPTTPEEETSPQPQEAEEPSQPPEEEEETSPTPEEEEEPEAPVETATSTGIGVEVVGTAPEGQTLIVDGQLVPVENWPVKIAGMTLVLTGPVNKSTSSSVSGSFNFTLIPAGEYVISVTEWNYGMTSQAFTAPSGKAIKITLKGSCPYLYVWDGKGYAKENDIYSVARIYPSELMTDEGRLYADRDGLFLQQVSLENMSQKLISQKTYRDYYRIDSRFAVDPDGYYRAKVREQAYERSLSDQFELWIVDHPAGIRTGVTRNGRLFQYEEILPLTATAQPNGTVLFDKEVMEVELPAAAFEKGLLAVEWQGFQQGDGRGKTSSAGKPSLFLQRLGPDGAWQTIDYVYPRDEVQQSFFILDDLGAGWDKGNTVRLSAASCHPEKFHRIHAVGWAEYLPKTPTAARLPLVSAVTSGGDDVRQKALEADGDSIFLGPDEEVFLKFKPYPIPEGMERSFIFVSQGVYVPMPRILLGEVQ